MPDTDVIIVGAAPTGLTLARELRLAGVRVLVLERLAQPWEVPKAGGLGGRILQLLRYRGLLDRFEAASGTPPPTPRFPFGGLHVDLAGLDSPMQALLLPQPRLESLLEELATEAGADVRRGHEVLGLTQDDAGVTVDVRGADGPFRVTASLRGGLRRRGQPGPRDGRHRVPRHHLPRGAPVRLVPDARVGDAARRRRLRDRGPRPCSRRVHPDRARHLRHQLLHAGRSERLHLCGGIGLLRRRRAHVARGVRRQRRTGAGYGHRPARTDGG